MEETIERMIPERHKQRTFYVEHIARYFFACQFIKNKIVLDIACGVGYGTQLLANAGAQKAIGIDNSKEAIEYAKEHYSLANTQYILGDALQIPLPDDSIDTIVSFETIEHVNAPEVFLQECKRVLKSGGVFVASTPNKKTYPRGNPFHLQEFTVSGYSDLLNKYFKNNQLLFQNNWLSSAILDSASMMKSESNVFMANIEPKNTDLSSYLVNISCDQPLPNAIRFGNVICTDYEDVNGALQRKDALIQAIYSSQSWKIGHRIIRVLKKIKSIFWKEHIDMRGRVIRRIGNESIQESIYREFPINKWNGGAIIFPTPSKSPSVSIIIPVYNKARYTMDCLQSIAKYTSNSSYEVIVVDDCSQDETVALLQNVKNITIVTNERNIGFVGSCNAGVRVSNGQYVLFLNNDTIVTEHWLEPLLKTIKDDRVGAVGAKLIYPTGALQEAGGIIWNDATGCNYGRNDDPDKPEYNFVREVDYCSGAALLVKKRLFEEVGGFDERFSPGYYEDTDLCFSLRRLGYRVVYHPQSIVIHFEGVTSGIDTNSGMKKYQEANRTKFYAKWGDVLKNDHYAPSDANVWNARTRNRKTTKHILIIDRYVPEFDVDAGSFQMYHLVKLLTEIGHTVTFIGDDLRFSQPYTKILQQCGVEVLYTPFRQSVDEYLALHGQWFDIVLLSRSHIARRHIAVVKRYCHTAKVVLNIEDLEYLRAMRKAVIEDDKAVLENVGELKKIELDAVEECDVIFVISSAEKAFLLKDRPYLNVEVVPSIHIPHPTRRPFNERRGIMFLGGFDHLPNVDAVHYFVKTILPLVKNKIPDIKFFVVGSHPPGAIQQLDSRDSIIVTGWVKDITPYFDQCRVFAAPLRYGAGVKGKILEAMAHGLPVVTTSIGAEGVSLEDGQSAMIADSPEEFAEKIIKLYANEQLWLKLSFNALRIITDRHSYDIVRARLSDLISTISAIKGFNKECAIRH